MKTETVKAVVDNLITAKVKRIKTELRTELGDNYLKMNDSDFLKLIDRENLESMEFLKNQLKVIYRKLGSEALASFAKECSSYSDAEFINDVQGVFCEKDVAFLKNVLSKQSNP